VAELRILHRLAERRDRSEADVEVGEETHPLDHRPLAEFRAQAGEHRLALRAFRELLPHELGRSSRSQASARSGLEGADGHVPAVARLVDRVQDGGP